MHREIIPFKTKPSWLNSQQGKHFKWKTQITGAQTGSFGGVQPSLKIWQQLKRHKQVPVLSGSGFPRHLEEPKFMPSFQTERNL